MLEQVVGIESPGCPDLFDPPLASLRLEGAYPAGSKTTVEGLHCHFQQWQETIPAWWMMLTVRSRGHGRRTVNANLCLHVVLPSPTADVAAGIRFGTRHQSQDDSSRMEDAGRRSFGVRPCQYLCPTRTSGHEGVISSKDGVLQQLPRTQYCKRTHERDAQPQVHDQVTRG